MDKTTSSVYRLLMGLIQLTSPPPPPPPEPTLIITGVDFLFPGEMVSKPYVDYIVSDADTLTYKLFGPFGGLVDTGSGPTSGANRIISNAMTMIGGTYFFELLAINASGTVVRTSSTITNNPPA